MTVEERERARVLLRGVGGQAAVGVRDAHRGVVGAERRAGDRERGVQTREQRLDRGRHRESAVQDDPRQRREGLGEVGDDRADEHVGTVAWDHDHGALEEPGQHVLERHAGDDDVEHGAIQQFGIAAQQFGLGGVQHGAQQRGDQFGILRDRPGRQIVVAGRTAHRRHHLVETLRVGPVDDDRENVGVLRVQLARGDRRDLRDVLGGAGLVAVGAATADDQQHARGQVGGDPAVDPQLGRGADVGVVRAEDDDGVAALLDAGEALHDAGECRIRVVVHLAVGGAEALLVLQVGARVLEQHLEDVVRLGRRARDRPEHPDPLDAAPEGGDEPHRHGRLSGAAFGGAQVDPSSHVAHATRLDEQSRGRLGDLAVHGGSCARRIPLLHVSPSPEVPAVATIARRRPPVKGGGVRANSAEGPSACGERRRAGQQGVPKTWAQ